MTVRLSIANLFGNSSPFWCVSPKLSLHVFILSFLADWNSKVSRLTTSWKWRVWFVSTCVGSLWSSAHIVYIDVSFPTKKASFLSESVAPTGGSNRLSCVGPVELGKTLGVPVEGCQLCWAYLAVWLLFALFHSWYERVEERIVKQPSTLPTLLWFSHLVLTVAEYDVRIAISLSRIYYLCSDWVTDFPHSWMRVARCSV